MSTPYADLVHAAARARAAATHARQLKDIERFNLKWTPEPNTGCWLWTAATTANGYGRFGTFRDGVLTAWVAHRFAYETFVGRIPDGKQLDHFVCSNTFCVNPKHVRPVTALENSLRSSSAPAFNLAKTHCPKGHPYEGDNLYLWGKGYRRCRTCARAHSYSYFERKRKRPPDWLDELLAEARKEAGK